MNELESAETIGARLEEVAEIVKGLENLDGELRQAAGTNLGRVEHVAYVGLTAQASLIATLRQTLKQRIEMLQKARSELAQPQGLFDDGPGYGAALRQQERSFPRRVPEDEDPPEHG